MRGIFSVAIIAALSMSILNAEVTKEYKDLSNRYKWIGVYVKEKGKVDQVLKSNTRFYEFKDTIKRLWNSGCLSHSSAIARLAGPSVCSGWLVFQGAAQADRDQRCLPPVVACPA